MTTEEHLKQLTAAIIRLDAKCDALEIGLAVVAGQVGIEPKKICEAIAKVREQRHQQLLESLENKSPALAASLDFRLQSLRDFLD